MESVSLLDIKQLLGQLDMVDIMLFYILWKLERRLKDMENFFKAEMEGKNNG